MFKKFNEKKEQTIENNKDSINEQTRNIDDKSDLIDLRKNIGSMIGKTVTMKTFAPSRLMKEEAKMSRFIKNTPVKIPRLVIPASGHLDFEGKKHPVGHQNSRTETQDGPLQRQKQEEKIDEEWRDSIISDRGESVSTRGRTLRKLKLAKQGSSVKIRKSTETLFSESVKDQEEDFLDAFSQVDEYENCPRKPVIVHKTKEKAQHPCSARINLSLKKDDVLNAFTNQKLTKNFESSLPFRRPSDFSEHHKSISDILQQARNSLNQKISHSIPCLLFNSKKQKGEKGDGEEISLGGKLVLFFHANGEDLSDIHSFCKTISSSLNINVLAVEYPGYGLYKDVEANEENILKDSESVLEYVKTGLKIALEDVIILGRSIGSGPSIHLASKYPAIGGLLLISAFSSIKEIVKDKYGKFASFFVNERFNNLSKIEKVRCRVKIIHGEKDELVGVDQVVKLKGRILVNQKN